MDERDAIALRIRDFIVKKFPAARKRLIDDDVPLLAGGIVDSLGMLDVVPFLEQSFAIKVLDEELTPENFANLRSMTSFVKGKQFRTEVPAK